MLVLVLVINLGIPVFAQTTTLTTTVPNSFPLHLEINGEGQVLLNGVYYDTSVDISVPRYSEIVITLLPKEGYHISHIFYNGSKVDMTDSMTVSLPVLAKESTVSIGFLKTSTSPVTGDNSKLLLLLSLLIVSGIGLVVLFLLRKRHTAA